MFSHAYHQPVPRCALLRMQSLLAQHPDAEARICEELQGLGLLAAKDAPSPRLLEYEDLAKLTYLNACLKVRLTKLQMRRGPLF